MPVRYHNPADLHQPAGQYSHVAIGEQGRLAVLAGQIPLDQDNALIGPDDIGAQVEQAFRNVTTILDDLGAQPPDILELRTFLVGEEAPTRPTPGSQRRKATLGTQGWARWNLAAFRQARESLFTEYFDDDLYPPSTLLIVSGLASPEINVELAATVLVPS